MSRIKTRVWDEVTKDVSLRLNIPQVDVDRVLASQFAFIRDAIHSGEFKCVQMLHLGKIGVRPGRIGYLNHMRELAIKRRENERVEQQQDRVQDSE